MATTAQATTDQEALVQLILDSKAILPAEKQYWIDLLPNMSGDQLAQLQTILGEEQQKQEQIDAEYDQKLEAISEKYLNRWDSEKTKAERLKREQKEAAHAEEASEKAESLLEGF